MTRDEILAEPAGLEMDAAVARAVFDVCLHVPGWTVELTRNVRECTRCGCMIGAKEFVAQLGMTYSTSDAAALEVLRAMAEKNPNITFAITLEDRGWYAGRMYWNDQAVGDVPQPSTTLALAICRAALLAKLPVDG